MIQKQFQIKTPARGATVGGTVADLIGNPLEGVLVRLGSHATVTNKEGRYRLLFVPPGDYTISLDESRLSAEYSAIDPPKQIETTLGSSHTVDWTVAPLNTIFGIVCEDANSDGDCGPDEGLKGIPVFLGAKVTATLDDGVFVFYNLLPGPYSVRLKEDHLPKGYVLESPLSASVEVKPGEAVFLIRFLLKRKTRPIIFQSLRATENQ